MPSQTRVETARYLRSGDTIWLNPSEKLLRHKEWLATPYDELSEEAKKELEHHSHSHTSVTITAASNYHRHGSPTLMAETEPGYEHGHLIGITGTGDTHAHANCILTFGFSSLGSPWWNHTHTVSLTSMDLGGAVHAHTTKTSPNAQCEYEWDTGAEAHSHTRGTWALGNAGGAHAHTLTGAVTGVGDATATPDVHTHTFSINFDVADVHTHAQSGNTGSTTCPFGYNHLHGHPATCATVSHLHTGSGTSGAGGEPGAAVAQPVGDGLAFAS